MLLDLNLAPELVLHVRLLELVFEKNLERDDVLAPLLARKVHVAELTAAQRLADVEIAQLSSRGIRGRRGRRAET